MIFTERVLEGMKLTLNHSEVSHERLGTEPVNKLLFKMALPSVIAIIMQALYNLKAGTDPA